MTEDLCHEPEGNISVLRMELMYSFWTGTNYDEICEFIGYFPVLACWNSKPYIAIHTLEGDHYAFIGDWIIRGIKGEFYPCKPDIFEKTYEEVSM